MRTVFPLSLLAVLCVVGCTPKESDTAQDTGNQQESLQQGENPCEASTDAYEVLYQGGGFFNEPIGNGGVVIGNQAEWDAFVTGFSMDTAQSQFSRSTFDWTVEQVAVASVFEASTCGLSLNRSDSCELDGDLVIYMEVIDSSGGCEAVCDAEGQVVYIVAIPVDLSPTFEIAVLGGCE